MKQPDIIKINSLYVSLIRLTSFNSRICPRCDAMRESVMKILQSQMSSWIMSIFLFFFLFFFIKVKEKVNQSEIHSEIMSVFGMKRRTEKMCNKTALCVFVVSTLESDWRTIEVSNSLNDWLTHWLTDWLSTVRFGIMVISWGSLFSFQFAIQSLF